MRLEEKTEYEKFAASIWKEMAAVRSRKDLSNEEKAKMIRELSNTLKSKNKN